MKAETLYEAVMPYKNIIETLATSMRKNPAVVAVSSDLELRRYESGPIIEAYVEAELSNSEAVTWWLDVRPSGTKWSFEARILGHDDLGETTLHVFPIEVAVSREGCIKAFHDAIMDAKWIDYYATQRTTGQLRTAISVMILALGVTVNEGLGEAVRNQILNTSSIIAVDPQESLRRPSYAMPDVMLRTQDPSRSVTAKTSSLVRSCC